MSRNDYGGSTRPGRMPTPSIRSGSCISEIERFGACARTSQRTPCRAHPGCGPRPGAWYHRHRWRPAARNHPAGARGSDLRACWNPLEAAEQAGEEALRGRTSRVHQRRRVPVHSDLGHIGENGSVFGLGHEVLEVLLGRSLGRLLARAEHHDRHQKPDLVLLRRACIPCQEMGGVANGR
jgi:hypothetical protein